MRCALKRTVLILVVMEYGLGVFPKKMITTQVNVLILVVMEYGLGGSCSFCSVKCCCSLNPCCNGIWSRRQVNSRLITKENVLILVVMEYGLGENI